MKKIFYVLTAVLAALAFVSCEDFLTKTPQTALSPSSFFKTESDLELWTNKFYSDLLEDTDIAETYCDDMMGTSLNTLQKGTRTASSKSWSTPSVNSSGYISSNGTFTYTIPQKNGYVNPPIFFKNVKICLLYGGGSCRSHLIFCEALLLRGTLFFVSPKISLSR
jgi:hypothetical protein